MQPGQPSTSSHQIVMEYRSPEGAEVTQVRGAVLHASLQQLKQASLYDRYLAALPHQHHEGVLYSLASSWLPLEVASAHCAAVDALGLSERTLEEHGQQIGEQLATTLFAAVLRTALSMAAGSGKGWALLKLTDRVMQRLYHGGCATLLQAGPKDAVMEIRGLPLFTSRYFRNSHHGYIKNLIGLVSTTVYVKPVRPREPHPHSAATSISWV